jgi:hypothetical protein
MNIATRATALCLLLAFAAPSALAAAAHQHASTAASPPAHAAKTTAKAAPAKGWATDAPLRAGMARIRQSVADLAHYERGHMGPEQAVGLAGDIEKDVGFLVKNCKLEPAADAALHGIIGQLMKGTQALKSKPSDLSALAPMRAALDEYARTFNDPAFRKAAAAK